MDLAEIWRVMRRRWYVLLPGLALTAALTAGLYLLVPVEYRSQSTVTLLNSKKATVAFDGNPSSAPRPRSPAWPTAWPATSTPTTPSPT